MADNVVVTAGTGTTIHADEYTHTTLGAGKTQLVKLVDGTLDAEAAIAADVGVKANALRVCPANNITDETYIGDIKFGEAIPAGTALMGKVGIDQATANANEVVVKSGTVTTCSTVTNLSQLGGVAISMNEGVVGTGVQRVTIATDDDSVAHLATIAGDTTSLDTKVTACNTGAVVLASGTVTTVSTVTAVTNVTSLDKAVYVDDADWTDNTSSHTLVGGVYQSAPHTVTDGDVSPFQLDVNGKIMVSGVTACNTGAVVLSSGTVTTVSTVTNLSQLGGTAISMDEGTVDGGCQRVTLATDDDGVAHLSSIATNTTRAAITGYGQAKLDHADVTTAQVLIAAVADKKFYITSIILSVAAAGSYWIEDDDAAQITCKYTLAANGGVAISFPIDTPYKSTTVFKGLKVKGSVAGVIGCQITYYTLA